MTEEIKKLIVEEARICVKGTPNTCSNFVEYGFTKGAQFGYNLCLSKWQEANRWRKVSEELPEVLTDVLIKDSFGKIDIGCLYDNGIWGMTPPIDRKITHWKPIE